MSTLPRPTTAEFAPYYANYVAQVPDADVRETLRAQIGETLAWVRALPESRGTHRYAEGHWSIKEVLGHMADTERVMSYRLLRISRGDATPLPGFEQDDYVRAARFDARTLASLAAELELVRAATLALVDALDEEMGARRGTANGVEVTARALAWIIAGHERHHLRILRERYG